MLYTRRKLNVVGWVSGFARFVFKRRRRKKNTHKSRRIIYSCFKHCRVYVSRISSFKVSLKENECATDYFAFFVLAGDMSSVKVEFLPLKIHHKSRSFVNLTFNFNPSAKRCYLCLYQVKSQSFSFEVDVKPAV